MKSILLDHHRRYPRWELSDIYKLMYQAAFGPGHAIASEEAAQEWLMRELDSLEPGIEEPLIDPISPDGQIVRVHLRPLAALQINPAELLQAFVRSASELPSDTHGFEQMLRSLILTAGEESLPYTGDQIKQYFEQMRLSGYPAVHHSRRYREAYKPAYRVVLCSFLPDI